MSGPRPPVRPRGPPPTQPPQARPPRKILSISISFLSFLSSYF